MTNRRTLRGMAKYNPTTTTASAIRLDFDPMARRRRWVGMTQKQLAEAIGVHHATIHRTERNLTQPSLIQMFAIARALGMPLTQLVTVLPLDAPDGRA